MVKWSYLILMFLTHSKVDWDHKYIEYLLFSVAQKRSLFVTLETIAELGAVMINVHIGVNYRL